MSALIDYIQIEIHKTYNKKYSKKYIEDKLIPIINYICSSKSKKFLFGGSQGCLLYTSPSPRDSIASRMPSSA